MKSTYKVPYSPFHFNYLYTCTYPFFPSFFLSVFLPNLSETDELNRKDTIPLADIIHVGKQSKPFFGCTTFAFQNMHCNIISVCIEVIHLFNKILGSNLVL